VKFGAGCHQRADGFHARNLDANCPKCLGDGDDDNAQIEVLLDLRVPFRWTYGRNGAGEENMRVLIRL